ncbi:SDR family oxidoreductase [Sphingobacterium hungaricum]|uniref:Short-chain dehydrogenase n=1 Tax=Sphingobacterium hungaricum TaxID=2082723 RepID=A0A928UTT8_9SPHI|nr:SDR family oxidoreductase [Sphingobacterium hungaricum]MBE8712612.1 short-chain dehydrogenase [Sphingobacterium hungaricum]
MKKKKILITGTGSGFAKDAAIRLAELGHTVIATVEIMSQVSVLEQELRDKKLKITVEKLDVTSEIDRKKAFEHDIDILISNAGISEGGAVVDLPEENIRRQFEVNVFGTIFLIQGFAKHFVKKKKGRIISISSIAGLSVAPFTGAYSASKHALEAFSEAMYKELREFGVEVCTINPGPYLTGFNDRMFEAPSYWKKDKKENVFDYDKINFPDYQFNPDEVVEKIIAVATDKITTYRNVLPDPKVTAVKDEESESWTRDYTKDLGKRHKAVQMAYKMKPGTKVKGY